MEKIRKCAIRWKKYLNNIQTFIRQVAASKHLADVTIVCEDSSGRFLKLKAHKFVLCALSSYFAKYFANDDGNTSSIFMQGIPYTYMTYLLDFMYYGEIQLPYELLQKFLEYGNQLRIEGLQGVTYSAIVSSCDSNQTENTKPKNERPAKKANSRKRGSDGTVKLPASNKSATSDSPGLVASVPVTHSDEPVAALSNTSINCLITEPMETGMEISVQDENVSPRKRHEKKESPQKRGESPQTKKESLQEREESYVKNDTKEGVSCEPDEPHSDVLAQLDVTRCSFQDSPNSKTPVIKSEPVDYGYSPVQNASAPSTASVNKKQRKKRSYSRRKPSAAKIGKTEQQDPPNSSSCNMVPDPLLSGVSQPDTMALPSNDATNPPMELAEPESTSREFAGWPDAEAEKSRPGEQPPTIAEVAATSPHPIITNSPTTIANVATTTNASTNVTPTAEDVTPTSASVLPNVADLASTITKPITDSPPTTTDLLSTYTDEPSTVADLPSTDSTPIASTKPSTGQAKRLRSSKKRVHNKNTSESADSVQNGIPLTPEVLTTPNANQDQTTPAPLDGCGDPPLNEVKKRSRASRKRASAIGAADDTNSGSSSPLVDGALTPVSLATNGSDSPTVKAKRKPRSARKQATKFPAAEEGASTVEENAPQADELDKVANNQEPDQSDAGNIVENIQDSKPLSATESTMDGGATEDALSAGRAPAPSYELGSEAEPLNRPQKDGLAAPADPDSSPKRSRTIKKPARLLDKNFIEDESSMSKKRRSNPFLIFSAETRPFLREQFPGETLGATQKRLSAMWNELDPYTKAKYHLDED